jgi:hypothetical protein
MIEIRKGFEKGNYPLCFEHQGDQNVLLTRPQIIKRGKILCKKYLGLNIDLPLRKIINCCNVLDLRNSGKYLFRAKGK